MGMNPNCIPHARHAGLLFAAALLITLTGCVGYTDRAIVGPGGVSPGHVGSRYSPTYNTGHNTGSYGYGYASANNPANYTYYPRYGTYYSPQSRQYYYQRGSTWETHRSPHGVSSRALFRSPGVPLHLQDSPSHHHAQVTRSYPRDWSPPGQHHGQHPHADRGAYRSGRW